MEKEEENPFEAPSRNEDDESFAPIAKIFESMLFNLGIMVMAASISLVAAGALFSTASLIDAFFPGWGFLPFVVSILAVFFWLHLTLRNLSL